MTSEVLYTQAVLAWIAAQGSGFRDLVLQGYPRFDAPALFRGLAAVVPSPGEPLRCALAIEGFDLSRMQLDAELRASGYAHSSGLAVLANEAVGWRNQHQDHPHIIAITAAQNRVASTLEDFTAPAFADLAAELLRWAADSPAFGGASAVSRRLLEFLLTLRSSEEAHPLRAYLSLDGVVAVLRNWSENPVAADGARAALHELGDLLPDSELWEHSATEQKIGSRLRTNLETVAKITQLRRAEVASTRQKLEKVVNDEQRGELLELAGNVEQVRRLPVAAQRAALDLPRVLAGYFGEPPPAPGDPPKPAPPVKPPRPERLTDRVADLLLDGEAEELATIAAEYVERIVQAVDEQEKVVLLPLDAAGERHEQQPVPTAFLGWVHRFCTASAWGGFLESAQASLAKSLEEEQADVHLLDPQAIQATPNHTFSIRERLVLFETELRRTGADVAFTELWDEGVRLRTALLDRLIPLADNPLLVLSGLPADRQTVEDYLRVRAALFGQIAQHEAAMRQLSQGSHAELVEAVLALDIVQVRTPAPGGEGSYKAVLLPLHPLNLWRYHRLATVANNLGEHLSEAQRRRVRELCREPHQFLSVLYAPSLPAGRGMGNILPLSGEIHGLATFENFSNALTCADGVEALVEAVRRFHFLYPHHSRPLRVALINPPEATATLGKLVELLKLPPDYLRRLRIEVFATERFPHRLIEARQLETDRRDAVEERIREGRLEFVVSDTTLPMEEITKRLQREPVHVAALFDEAHPLVRRTTSRAFYPMSPFVVRQELQPDSINGTIKLEPTSDDDLFQEFLNLLRSAASLQRSQIPRLAVEAERLCEPIDAALRGDPPGAFWFFLADRGLPAESEIRSVRLQRKTVGRRQVLLCARDWERIESRLRPAFSEHWSRTAPGAVAELLGEGTLLTGGGVLGLLNERAQTTDPQVRGFLGMVIAAREYRLRHPDALLCSVDGELARLWLRLDEERGHDRCDLLALREEAGALVVECIEVKTRTARDGEKDGREEVPDAQLQVLRTLEALAEALPDDPARETSTGKPKNEMLKEVLVHGAQSSHAPRERRLRWNDWLLRLFNDQPAASRAKLRGTVVLVQLCKNRPAETGPLAGEPFPIELRTLTEPAIALVFGEPPDHGEPPPPASEPPPRAPQQPPAATLPPPAPREAAEAAPLAEPPQAELSLNVPQGEADPWPPEPNALGLIGLERTARQLLDDVQVCARFGRRFSDKLLAGPPGVGKTTIAEAISRRLLDQAPIRFSGADFREAQQLIDAFEDRGLLPPPVERRVRIGRSLVFVDEVHAVPPILQTWLLSATDDARLTTHQGVEFDFAEVTFIIATTHLGKMLVALRSRFEVLELPPYTLEELAAILCHRGREQFDGFVLPRAVCVEIAARCRCSPREAVRCMQGELFSYTGARLTAHAPNTVAAIGANMSVELITRFFEEKGVDINGIDERGQRLLRHLERHDSASEAALKQALQIYDLTDFRELEDYLRRLGLVEIRGARRLTSAGRRYLRNPTDLRELISRRTPRV